MSIIVHGGTIDATKIAVPRSQGGWSLEALARYIPPTLVAKPVNIVQEIYGIYLAHNAIRALMHEAALRVDIDPRTLSFINAVRVIRDAIPLLRAARRNQLPKLYHGLLAQIGRGTLPPRDGRINPRVVKIKMSNYKKKGPEHLSPPQPCIPFDIDVFILK